MINAQAYEKTLRRPLGEASVALGGMTLFALFVHSGLPLVFLSGAGLLTTALAIVHTIRTEHSISEILALRPVSLKASHYLVLGCAVGAMFGILFRLLSNMAALPAGLGEFFAVAATIGAAEELLFRGYLQGRFGRVHRAAAVILAAASHTTYKLALFALPPVGNAIDHQFLAIYTFAGGVVFGALRELCGSVLPPLAGHMLFDILVYGEKVDSPWWVWS